MRIIYWAKMALARPQIIDAVGKIPGVELQVVPDLDDVVQALPGAAGLVLLHAPEAQARRVMDVLKSPANTVKWMHFVSAGREGFEELGWPKGVIVTYAGGGVSPAVAEHAMALMLALARRVPDMVSVTQRQTWDRSLAAKATSLEGATLAIVGWGHIGKELAKRARPFGMRIVSAARTPRPDPLVDRAYPLAELKQALAEADVVAITVALTPETTHLVGAAEFAACQRGVLFVNVARGPIIDHAALAAALESGQVGGAAVDVTDPEPLPDGHPFWRTPNLLVSPHFAGAGSPKSVDRLAAGVADNLRKLIAGQPLDQVVSAG